MTAHELLTSNQFFKYKTEGCSCGPNGKAVIYKMKTGDTEVRLYPKKKRFKITQPGKIASSGSFVELSRVLKVFMAA